MQGIASIPSVRLERRLGKLPEAVVAEIGRALLFAFDLTVTRAGSSPPEGSPESDVPPREPETVPDPQTVTGVRRARVLPGE